MKSDNKMDLTEQIITQDFFFKYIYSSFFPNHIRPRMLQEYPYWLRIYNQTTFLLHVKYSNDYLFCLHSRITSLTHQKCNQKAKVKRFLTEIVLTKYVIFILFLL